MFVSKRIVPPASALITALPIARFLGGRFRSGRAELRPCQSQTRHRALAHLERSLYTGILLAFAPIQVMLLGKESSPDLLSRTIISVISVIPPKKPFSSFCSHLRSFSSCTRLQLHTQPDQGARWDENQPAKKREEGGFDSDRFLDPVYNAASGRFAAAQGKASSARLNSKQLRKCSLIYSSAEALPRLGKK